MGTYLSIQVISIRNEFFTNLRGIESPAQFGNQKFLKIMKGTVGIYSKIICPRKYTLQSISHCEKPGLVNADRTILLINLTDRCNSKKLHSPRFQDILEKSERTHCYASQTLQLAPLNSISPVVTTVLASITETPVWHTGQRARWRRMHTAKPLPVVIDRREAIVIRI